MRVHVDNGESSSHSSIGGKNIKKIKKEQRGMSGSAGRLCGSDPWGSAFKHYTGCRAYLNNQGRHHFIAIRLSMCKKQSKKTKNKWSQGYGESGTLLHYW